MSRLPVRPRVIEGTLRDHGEDRFTLARCRKLGTVYDHVVARHIAALVSHPLLLLLLTSHTHLVVGRLGQRHNLANVQQHPVVESVGDELDAADVHGLESVEPQH